MSSPGNPNFLNENNPGVKFSSDRQPDNSGRPVGVKNRSTIARKVLEMTALLPTDMLEKLKETFPDMTNKLTVEEIATIVMMGKAIADKDVNAYKAVMDSGYGMPKAEIEHSGDVATPTPQINIYNSGPDLNTNEKDADV